MLNARPETLVLMITAYATVENAVASFRRGAHDYLMKPVLFDELLVKLDRLMGFRNLSIENQALRRQIHQPVTLDELVGESVPMRAVKSLIRKVGPTRSNVLILGESGTGKELAARALHALGVNPDAPFLAINCAAIPHDLLENQLFGHVRGAFTGADRDNVGLFRAAGAGSVFLDEIGELPLPTQAKLLRAIESREVLPIGATRPIAFKARVIAATNKDLSAEAAASRFRTDLYYRLNVVSILLPPLRDRLEDIRPIARALMSGLAAKLGRSPMSIEESVLTMLESADWKGNVRELENALERGMILSDASKLRLEDFQVEANPRELTEDGDDLRIAVERFERRHIARILASCDGDKREAARRLGLGLSSLYRKLEESTSI